jgi:hypothetical protein
MPSETPASTPTATLTSVNTPTATPTPTPTQTATSGSTAQLQGAVTLQGRPAPPDPRWVVPLQVSLTPQGGGTAVSCTPTTDESGDFECDGFVPGTYTACVKNSQTLQNCQSVTLAAGANPVDFGTLREGDANNDNCVLLVDFSILATTFGKCAGDAGFDARADFGGSGCVVLVDFSLLATNFGQCGVTAPSASASVQRASLAVVREAVGGGEAAGPVSLRLRAPRRVRAGQRFVVPVEVEAGAQQVDGAAAYVDFDPRVLRVEAITPGEELGVELHRRIDNAAGQVGYAAATLGDFPTGTFRLVTLRFRALRAGPAQLVLHRGTPRQSDVTFGGASVLGSEGAAPVRILSNGSSSRR